MKFNLSAKNKTASTTPTSLIDLNKKNSDIGCDMGNQCGIVTSVGLAMPPAFTVQGSPIHTSGIISVTGAGLSSQYISGEGKLITFPVNISFFNNDEGYITSAALAGYVPIFRTITINGIVHDLSVNRSWTIDSLPLQTGNNGKWLFTNGSSASWQFLSGNISLFTNDSGYITIADLSPYLLITDAASIYTPMSRNLTINGVTHNLTADQSWTITEAVWGNITGTLSDQTDLQAALDAKQNTITTGTTAQYFRGDLSLATFPTNVSFFTNDSGYITSASLAPYLLSSTAASTYTPLSRNLTINGVTFDLSTDRTWTVDTLPSQTGNNGKWLTTNGTSASWAVLSGNVSLFTNDAGYITSSALTGYVQNTRTLTINGTTFDLSSNRTWNVGTVTSIAATAGTGISIGGSPITGSGTLTITNTAPDQTVVLSNGTAISVTGTYPSFTITNTAPDQTVVLNNGTGISATGTYPNFTITNTLPDQTVVLTQGSGITITGTYPNFTIATSGGGGTVSSVSLTMPTGFSVANSPVTTAGTLAVSTTLNGILKGDGSGFGTIVVGSGLTYDGTTLATTQNLQDGITSGGAVVWLHDYVYNVSPATYVINGVAYSSPSTDITLAAASLTDDRIDLFVLTTSGTAIAITGTASTPPTSPDYDANTQLFDSFAIVSANTSAPPNVVNDWIYQENAEWTTSASAGTINPNSTNNPYAGTKDVEGTSVLNNQFITFTSPTTPNMGLYQHLLFEIRSKANWSTTKKWIMRWYNGTTPIGNAVTLGQGSYGFVSTNTTTYQTITIPLTDFGNISAATVFRITQSNTSGNIGWYLDNLQLQSTSGVGTPQTITLTTDATGTGTNTISTTVVGIRNKTIPSLSAGFLKYTGSAWTFDSSTYLTANQAIIVTATGDATGTSSSSGTAPSLPLTLATVNSNVGTFGDSTHVGQFTVNGKGLITAASNVAISGFASSTLTNTHIFVGNVSNVATDVALSGDATLANTGALTLATVNSNVGSFTNASITVNAKGLITAASSGTAPVTSVGATAPITTSGGTTPTISTSMSTGKLIGRSTAGTGVMEEISVGSGLSLSGGTLTATGSGGTVTTFSAGTLSPLFTTSVSNATTTPALSFSLTNAAANTYFGNATGSSGAPSYTAAAALSKADDTNVTLTLTGSPTVSLLAATTLTLGWTGTLGTARGGTNVDSSAWAQGDIVYISATGTWNHLAKNTTATRYLANTGSSNTPNWDQVNLANGVTGTLPVANGGTGQSTYTDGQLLIGNSSGNTLTKATLTAGGNITITNGNGSITIAASSPSLAATAMFNYLNFY